MRHNARRLLPVAALAAAALALTSCGARVDEGLRQQAARAQLATGGGSGTGSGDTALGAGAGTGTDTGSGAGTGTSGSGGTDTSAAAGGASAAGSGSGSGSGGGSGSDSGSGTRSTSRAGTSSSTSSGTGKGSSPAAGGSGGGGVPAGGNGGATDVGVTANSLTVGTVASLSGPVPGLFEGAVIGTQAYVAKVNAEGGVFGRQLQVAVGDDQLDCGQNKAQTANLSGKVFAFVGSFSLYDDCGAQVLQSKPEIPDVHNGLGNKASGLPNNFSVAPLPQGWRTGPLLYYKKTYGDKFTKIGSIYAAVGGADATWAGTKGALQSVGGKVIYERGFQPTDTDFTADIVRMRNAGVKMLYITASDAPTFARIIKAARSQRVDWPILAGGIAYDESFLKAAGSDAEGVFNDQQFSLFFNPDEASRSAGVRDFQTWTSRVAPGKKRDVFAVFGWSSAELFVKALKAAGPKATRKDVLAQLQRITKFDAEGLIAPANPAQKKPPTCWLLAQVKGGRFVRVMPSSGYDCTGGYYYGKAALS